MASLAQMKVGPTHFDHNAHLGEAGAHALTDSVAQALLAHGALWAAHARAAGRMIGVVGGDDGGSLVVVARVEDVGHGVPYLFGGLRSAEFVENEDFGLEDRAQNFKLGGEHLRIVRVLDLLEQLAVVTEEPADAFLDDQRLQDADGEMGFAYSDRSGKQQAMPLSGRRISVDKA